jgi:hypothetical protein
LGVTASNFYDWRERYGCVNEHNGWVPRDFWLELWEKEAIIDFHLKNPAISRHKDMLAGRQQEIQADRDGKLEAAREHRKNRRQRAA